MNLGRDWPISGHRERQRQRKLVLDRRDLDRPDQGRQPERGLQHREMVTDTGPRSTTERQVLPPVAPLRPLRAEPVRIEPLRVVPQRRVAVQRIDDRRRHSCQPESGNRRPRCRSWQGVPPRQRAGTAAVLRESLARIDRQDVLDLITGLIDKSLVTTDEQGPQTRYGLLETVRQYATARLVDAGELDAVRDRHLAIYLTLAEAADPEALDAERDDPEQHDLVAELPNLRAALERAAATDSTAGLKLVDALTLFWLFTGRYRPGDTAYARALDAAGREPTPLRARVLSGRGILGVFGGAYEAQTPRRGRRWRSARRVATCGRRGGRISLSG